MSVIQVQVVEVQAVSQLVSQIQWLHQKFQGGAMGYDITMETLLSTSLKNQESKLKFLILVTLRGSHGRFKDTTQYIKFNFTGKYRKKELKLMGYRLKRQFGQEVSTSKQWPMTLLYLAIIHLTQIVSASGVHFHLLKLGTKCIIAKLMTII